jgi:hypothetical protein
LFRSSAGGRACCEALVARKFRHVCILSAYRLLATNFVGCCSFWSDIVRSRTQAMKFSFFSLQIQRFGFYSRRYQIFREVVGLERGALSLMSTTEELLERKCSGSGLETRKYGCTDSSR